MFLILIILFYKFVNIGMHKTIFCMYVLQTQLEEQSRTLFQDL